MGNRERVYEFEEGSENSVLDNFSFHASILCIHTCDFHTNRFSDSVEDFLSKGESSANRIDSVSSFFSSLSEVDRHFDTVV